MNIEKAQYRTDKDGNNVGIVSTIDGIEYGVPLDPANRHYQAILEWAKEDGNEIAEAD
tara:strand:+ start:648 stop:821 length:174 start_codon:yes stop_codon:yes gene_type:complete